MQKLIKIISVEPSEKGNWSEITYKDDGKPFSKNIFPPLEAIAQANVGKEMSATFEKKEAKDGKSYWNIVKLEDPSAMPAPAASGNGGGGGGYSRGPEQLQASRENVAARIIADKWDDMKEYKTGKLNRYLLVWLEETFSGLTIPILNKDGNNPLKPTDKQQQGITELLQKQIDDGLLEGYDDGECAFRAMVDLDYGGTLTMEDADQWYKRLLQAEKKAKK